MAHFRRGKGGVIVVASVALGSGGDMVGWLSNGIGAVMASRAVAGSRGGRRSVVEAGRGPGSGCFVAGIALRCGADVGGRFCLRV